MFQELDVKKVGQSIGKLRRHREVKASEVAAFLGITEQAYTKYERGETVVSLDMLNRIGRFFDVQPLHFLAHGPETIVENVHNNVVHNHNSTIHTTDARLVDAITAQLTEKDQQIRQLIAMLNT